MLAMPLCGPDLGRDCEPMPAFAEIQGLDLAFGRAFTLAEVAEKLGISLRQVQSHVADGTMSAINVGRGPERRDLRVTDEALEEFARRRRLGVAPQSPRGRGRGR